MNYEELEELIRIEHRVSMKLLCDKLEEENLPDRIEGYYEGLVMAFGMLEFCLQSEKFYNAHLRSGKRILEGLE